MSGSQTLSPCAVHSSALRGARRTKNKVGDLRCTSTLRQGLDSTFMAQS